jgi:hypothetical protein
MVFGPAPDQPLYGRRVVLVQFKVGEDYLSLPQVVIADLTESRVILEAVSEDASGTSDTSHQ